MRGGSYIILRGNNGMQPTILTEQHPAELTIGRWMLEIFDNDTTPREFVVFMLIKATGCTGDEAEMETWEAETFGRAAVHFGPRDICEAAGGMMNVIGVATKVSPEWKD